jgi:hypothetical protein
MSHSVSHDVLVGDISLNKFDNIINQFGLVYKDTIDELLQIPIKKVQTTQILVQEFDPILVAQLSISRILTMVQTLCTYHDSYSSHSISIILSILNPLIRRLLDQTKGYQEISLGSTISDEDNNDRVIYSISSPFNIIDNWITRDDIKSLWLCTHSFFMFQIIYCSSSSEIADELQESVTDVSKMMNNESKVLSYIQMIKCFKANNFSVSVSDENDETLEKKSINYNQTCQKLHFYSKFLEEISHVEKNSICGLTEKTIHSFIVALSNILGSSIFKLYCDVLIVCVFIGYILDTLKEVVSHITEATASILNQNMLLLRINCEQLSSLRTNLHFEGQFTNSMNKILEWMAIIMWRYDNSNVLDVPGNQLNDPVLKFTRQICSDCSSLQNSMVLQYKNISILYQVRIHNLV